MYIYSTYNPNLWLGTPRTAANVVPVTAGLRYGYTTSEDGEAKGSLSTLRLGTAILLNASSSSSTLGLAKLVPDSQWIAGQWTNSTTTVVDNTANAQSAAVDTFNLFTTTASSGFVVQCADPFDLLSVDVTTATVGGTPAFQNSFWGVPLLGTGTTGWQAVTGDTEPTYTSTGEKIVNLPIPINHMVALAATDFTGARANWYAVRVRATTAPSTSGGKAARLYVGKKLYQQSGVASNGAVNPNPTGYPGARVIRGGVALGAFFSTAHSANQMYLEIE